MLSESNKILVFKNNFKFQFTKLFNNDGNVRNMFTEPLLKYVRFFIIKHIKQSIKYVPYVFFVS